jgi:Spy/CpxP family protein refolding chaperone
MASVVSVLAVCVGVMGSTVASAAPDPQQQAEPREAGAGHHRHHGHGDLLHASLRLESLSASQRQQIERLVASEKAATANVRAARGQLTQAVAAGLGSGSVNEQALGPQLQAVEGAIQADEPVMRGTLEKLHAVLTPAQRSELVGEIEAREARMHARHAQFAERRDGGAAQAKEAGGVGPWGRALGLTEAQRAQIKANLGSTPTVDPGLRVEARTERQRVLDAFKGDRFVMNEIAPARDPRLIDEEAGRLVRLAKAAAPVLTAEQRATAAAKLQQMAARELK